MKWQWQLKWQWQRQWQSLTLTLALTLAVATTALAQLKLRVVEDPKVGRDAPDFTAAYLTAAGPGPVDQPFHLNAELGHTVVLVFGAAKDSTVVWAQWQGLAAIKDSLFRPGIVVVGVVRQKAQPAGNLAAGLKLPFKLLPDSLGRAFQSYGVVGRESRERLAVFVVDPLGKLIYRSRDFSPSDGGEVGRLREAMK